MPYSKTLRDAIKQQNARVLFDEEGRDPDSPDFVLDGYEAAMADVQFVRDIYGGTKTVRAAGEIYLPKHPNEKEPEYERRLARAVLFNSFKRTVGGLVGMIFRKELILDVSATIERHADNIDQAGHTLTTFVRETAEDAMIDGHAWWLVEHPILPEEVPSAEHEAALDLRPYWVKILKEQVINVEYEVRNGSPFITLFTYLEQVRERAGAFGSQAVSQLRVLMPGAWKTYRQADDETWVEHESGSTSLDYVPVVIVPTHRTGQYESEPPLLDLAFESVDHYQMRSDHRHAAMFASTPMPYVVGADPEGVEWGSNRIWFIPDPGAAVGILESSGASLASTRQDQKDSEARQAALGLQMLVRETRAAETAEAKLLDKSESESALSVVATDIEAAINQALQIHADYMSDGDGGSVNVNRDFHEQVLSPAHMQSLSSMVGQGQLSLETMWAALVAGEVLPEDFDAELEIERIEGVIPPPLPEPPPEQPEEDEDEDEETEE